MARLGCPAPVLMVSLTDFVSRVDFLVVECERKKSVMQVSGWSNWPEGGFITDKVKIGQRVRTGRRVED